MNSGDLQATSERVKAIKGSESGGGAAVNASRQLEDACFHFLVLWENLKRSCCERAGEGTRGSVREGKYVPPPSTASRSAL